MDTSYWQKQGDKPLFENLEWDKPERRDQAGRLLIIGGYQHNLNAPAKAYDYTKEQGVGATQIALPNKVKRLVGSTLPGAIFLPSTASGELSRDGLNELLTHANWADTLLLPGDLGRNSQTTMLIADLLENTKQQAVLTKDAIDNLKNAPELVLKRENTTIVASFSQLQHLFNRVKWPDPITFSMGLVKLVEQLHEFTKKYPCALMTLHENNILVAVNGKISTTTIVNEEKSWRVQAASIAACYQTWNPNKPFEALTHTAYLLK